MMMMTTKMMMSTYPRSAPGRVLDSPEITAAAAVVLGAATTAYN